MTARAGSGGIAHAARRAVQAHFVAKMDKDVSGALADAMWSLHFGPTGGRQSYEECLRVLREWADKELFDVFYDVQGGFVVEDEPQSFEDAENGTVEEPFWEDYMRFDVADTKRLLFKDLIAHGGF